MSFSDKSVNLYRFFFPVLLAIAAAALVPSAVQASDVSANFDTSIATRGRTVVVDGVRFGLRVGIAEPTFDFTATTSAELPAAMPAGWTAASQAVTYDFTRPDGSSVTLAKNLWISIPYTARDRTRVVSVFQLDASGKRWKPLRTNLVRDVPEARLGIADPTATLVVAESDFAHVGVASWYRSTKYPAGAAYNDAPMGAKLLVENLENGKKVVVTVVSSGPFVEGRVVDLTNRAFEKIARRGTGLARVKVKPLTPAVAGSATVVGPAPEIGSPSAVVLDAATDTALFAKADGKRRPIASLTKLVAASVFLDTKTPMDRIVTYESADRAICSCLRVSPGETMRVRDLFSASLVGSANNAMHALVRVSGLSKEEFIRRMNEQAKAWGAGSASFVEPTGLDERNVATAREVAKLVSKAFENETIAKTTILKSYTFSTLNTGQTHTIRNRNGMLDESFSILGTKTGYIEESGFSLATKAAGKGGSGSVIVIVLGAATDRQRYDDTRALLNWALSS